MSHYGSIQFTSDGVSVIEKAGEKNKCAIHTYIYIHITYIYIL